MSLSRFPASLRWALLAAVALLCGAVAVQAYPGTGQEIFADPLLDDGYSIAGLDMTRLGATSDASNVYLWFQVNTNAQPTWSQLPGGGAPETGYFVKLQADAGQCFYFSIGYTGVLAAGESFWHADCNPPNPGVSGASGVAGQPLPSYNWVCNELRVQIPRTFWAHPNPAPAPIADGASISVLDATTNYDGSFWDQGPFAVGDPDMGTYTVGGNGANPNPTGLTVTYQASPMGMQLAWSAPLGGNTVSGYRIDRSVNGGAYSTIATVGPSPTTYFDATATASGTTYAYRVYALRCNNTLVGAYTQNQAVTPTVTTPPVCAPSSVSIATGVTQAFTATGGSGVYSWSAPSGSPSSAGSGSSFSTSYSAIGTYTVTVTSGSLTATCSVTVSAPVAGALGVTITSGPNFNVNINTNLAVFAVISNMNGPLGSDTCTWSITPSTGVTMTPLVSVTSCTSLTADSIQFLTTTPGTYTLTIVVDDDGAGPRTASASATITAIDPNALGVDIAGSGEATVGQAHVLAATLVTGNNASPVTCSWTVTPAVPFTANGCTSISFTPGGPGQYRITVSATRGTGANNNAVDEFYVFATVNGDAAVDTDKDGFADSQDNCPVDYNPGQYDSDGNGQGDMCEAYATQDVAEDAKGETTTEEAPDADKDGVADVEDNCPQLANSSQANLDADQLGDACDSDADGDRIADTGNGVLDNCRLVYNPLQEDRDQDGQGDACDIDGLVILANDNAQAGHASSQSCPSCSKEVATATEEGLPMGMLFVAGLAALGGMLAAVLALNRK